MKSKVIGLDFKYTLYVLKNMRIKKAGKIMTVEVYISSVNSPDKIYIGDGLILYIVP